jgi:hypothetical protein
MIATAVDGFAGGAERVADDASASRWPLGPLLRALRRPLRWPKMNSLCSWLVLAKNVGAGAETVFALKRRRARALVRMMAERVCALEIWG